MDKDDFAPFTRKDHEATVASIYRAQAGCFGTGHLLLVVVRQDGTRAIAKPTAANVDRAVGVIIRPTKGAPRIEGRVDEVCITESREAPDLPTLAKRWWDQCSAPLLEAKARRDDPAKLLVYLLDHMDWNYGYSEGAEYNGWAARHAEILRVAKTLPVEQVKEVWQNHGRGTTCPV
jgi:hypothetical protein